MYDPDNRRRSTRLREMTSAVVRIGTEEFRCIVRDHSRDGIHLEMIDPLPPHPRFTLSIPYQGRSVVAEVIWRDGTSLGVKVGLLTDDVRRDETGLVP